MGDGQEEAPASAEPTPIVGSVRNIGEPLRFTNVEPLAGFAAEAAKALKDPVTAAGEVFDDVAISAIYRLTQGYPYFLQEWGYQSWNHAASSPITLRIVQETTTLVASRLDENFFRVRFNRLTPREKMYLRSMAELGGGPYRTADIADSLGVKITTLGPVRASLIKKGMIYSPSHGDMAFTVPLFDQFMLRAIPEFEAKATNV